MSDLKFYLFGSPRVEQGGAVVEMDTRKALALLAYLVVTGTEQRRETLAALLWPEYDHTHAMGALRRTLSSLRKVLGEEHLVILRERVSISSPPAFWSDYAEFNALLDVLKNHGHPPDQVCQECLEPLARAAELYRDHFMAGFSLRDSSEFDDWQFFQAEVLRQKYSEILERLSQAYVVAGDLSSAITAAQRWLAVDPLHEPAHRQLMQLFAWTGQRNASLRQYLECVKILDKELGVKPLEETTALYHAIQENRYPVPALGKPATIPVTPASLVNGAVGLGGEIEDGPGEAGQFPLVGRNHEWSVIQSIYQRIQRDGHFVVLEGEPGIGKTRLAEEFLQTLSRSGAAVLRARCYQGESSLAYGPFVEILRGALDFVGRNGWPDHLPGQWLSEGARLLPELSTLRQDLPPVSPLESPGAQTRFFEGISQILLAACRNQQTGVILFDDLHWADEASLDLLMYLVRRTHGRPIFILATWRQEDVNAEHRLRRLLSEAQREGRATLLSLAPLSLASVQELVHNALSSTGKDPVRLSERLHHETDGLPFFVVEYLKTISSGSPDNREQEWRMPSSVRDLLFSRLAATSETGLQLLQTAAAIGRSFDFDTLREASGRSDEETVLALEALIQRGLVREMAGGAADMNHDYINSPSYDFSHEKIRDLVYEETSGARRKILHRRVAESLASRSHNRREVEIQAGMIARHFQLANRPAEAASYYKVAGDHARSLYANAEALTHFRSALALGYPKPAILNEAVGDLLTLSGDYVGARTSYERAISENGPDSQAVARLERKLGNVYDRNGEWELAEGHFRHALECLSDGEAAGEAARVYADWSLMAHHQGENARAQDLAGQSLQLAQQAGDQRALAQANNIIGILARSQEDYTLARTSFEQSLSLAEALDNPEARVAALNNLALVYGSQGDLERSRQLAETALQLCVVQGDRHREAALHNNLADLLHMQGELEAAMDHLKMAVAIFAEIGTSTSTNPDGLRTDGYLPEIWKLSEW